MLFESKGDNNNDNDINQSTCFQLHHVDFDAFSVGQREVVEVRSVRVEGVQPPGPEVDGVDQNEPGFGAQRARAHEVADLSSRLLLHPVVDPPGGLLRLVELQLLRQAAEVLDADPFEFRREVVFEVDVSLKRGDDRELTGDETPYRRHPG